MYCFTKYLCQIQYKNVHVHNNWYILQPLKNIYNNKHVKTGGIWTQILYNTSVWRIETDIITRNAARLVERAATLVIMSVETFQSDRVIFIGNIVMHLMSHWSIIFSIRVICGYWKYHSEKIKEKMPKSFWSVKCFADRYS